MLKSGAAYVPAEPDFPEERIRFMMDGTYPIGKAVSGSEIVLMDEDLNPVPSGSVESSEKAYPLYKQLEFDDMKGFLKYMK